MADESTATQTDSSEPPASPPATTTTADAEAAAQASANDSLRATGAAFLGQETVTETDDWSEPKVRENGVAVDGHGLPFNLRLRAEELAESGKDSDPANLVSAEHIADAKARLAAYDEQYPPLVGATKSDLEKIAEDEGVDLDGASNNDERVARIAAARPSRV